MDKKKTNYELGKEVHEHLVKLGIETPNTTLNVNARDHESVKLTNVKENMASILSTMGMDLKDDSLQDTPNRVAKMFVNEIFYGLDYHNFPKCMVVENKMKYGELVIVRDILTRSVCEHHLQPFIGKTHIAYVPKDGVVGLSKLNRVVDFFSRRPQVQERLTLQIHAAIAYMLGAEDVAVIVDAEHYCVKLRGVQDPGSSTITSKMGGRFFENPALRQEFLSLIKGN